MDSAKIIHHGDNGTTWGTHRHTQISKSSPLLDFYGNADQTIACLNIANLYVSNPEHKKILKFLIDLVSRLIGQIATNKILVGTKDYDKIEKYINGFNNPPLKHFILYFDSKSTAFLNLSRTYIRQLERSYYKIDTLDKNPLLQKILNRMSTLIFELIRQYQ